MSGEFKQCPNGHYYQGDHCPYCKENNSNPREGWTGDDINAPGGNGETKVYPIGGGSSMPPTGRTIGGETEVGGPTISGDGRGTYNGPHIGNGGAPTIADDGKDTGHRSPIGTDTMILDPMDDQITPVEPRRQPTPAGVRKMVGWLISYTLDPNGVDFKLYEGRNIIGRDMGCNITINDSGVSEKHAVLLFRSGKYSITDQQTSNGTFVNDRDIELEPCYLQDGDVIKIGRTILKFRSSL